jgi:hypothetical protein
MKNTFLLLLCCLGIVVGCEKDDRKKEKDLSPDAIVPLGTLNAGDLVLNTNRMPSDPFTMRVKQNEKFKVYAYSYSNTGSAMRHMIKIFRDGALIDSTLTILETRNSTGLKLPFNQGAFYTDPDNNSTESEYKIAVFKENGQYLDSIESKIIPHDDNQRGHKFLSASHYFNGNLSNPTDGIIVIVMNNFD